MNALRMRRLTIFDEVEIIMRERQWLPWYERYGVDFRQEMFRYPIERILPPDKELSDERSPTAPETRTGSNP